MPESTPAMEFEAVDVPPAFVGGTLNYEHYRIRIHNVVRHAEIAAMKGGSIPFNSESLVKMIYREFELAGGDLKKLADSRSEADKLIDFRDSLLADPNNAFEALSEVIGIAERQMNFADKECQEEIDRRKAELTPKEKTDRAMKLRPGKDWPGLLARLRRLQDRAKNPLPADTHFKYTHGTIAAHPLRYMMYVNRSSTMRLHDGSQSMQFKLAVHHCVFAVETWEARNGVLYPESGRRKGEAVVGGRDPFKVCLLIAPPGHNKSEFAMNYLALEYCLRPDTLAMYLHAVEDEAVKNKGYIARMFSPENASGRRCLALFPTLRLAKKDNNETTMRLELRENAKSPSLRAAGVMSAKLGADTKILVLDDIVPQSDADEPTTRERRCETVAGTFSSRQRGKDTFILCIGTIWHKDDVLSKYRKMADAESDVIQCNVQVCGGPETSPPFFPLWAEAYSASELRKRFEIMNRNTALWSAAYQANPLANADRVIRKLRFYDPLSDEHQDFMASAQMHVSVDPTATNGDKSDHAGIMHCALGEVSAIDDETRVWQTRLRIVDATRIHANQVELVDHVAAYTMQRPVYQVHVETRSGFHATADIFANKYGLEVNRLDPGPRSKTVRLKDVAGLIDDSSPNFRAIVEFPGLVRPDGSVGPDSKWNFMYEQLLDFGVCGQDEFVDTLSQIVKHFNRTGELVGGTAEASESIRQKVQLSGDPRDREWFRNLMDQANDRETVEVEENRWIADRWGAPKADPMDGGEFWKYK